MSNKAGLYRNTPAPIEETDAETCCNIEGTCDCNLGEDDSDVREM